VKVEISRRAGLDLAEIWQFSVSRWGERVANEYLDSIDLALQTLAAHPDLLRNAPAPASELKFYRIKQHYLVCTIVESVLYVVTIKHCNMDIPARLAELEPTLLDEVEIMQYALKNTLRNTR
jgi:plasmid stabilization system protein ParE